MAKLYTLPFILILGFTIITIQTNGQYSITSANETVTENFNGLDPSDMSGLQTGWIIEDGGSNVTSATVDDGSSTTAGVFSYGATAAADRAIGFLDDGTTSHEVGWEFTNNTGSAITHVAISYTGEQWRRSENPDAGDQTAQFSYKIGSGLSGGTFTDVNTLDYTTAACTDNFGGGFGGLGPDGVCDNAAGAFDGNANNTTFSVTVDLGAGIPDGSNFIVKWELDNPDNATNSHGTGIDDVSLQFLVSEAGVWYPRTGQEANLRQNSSWTAFASGAASGSNPTGDAFGDFTGTNETFVINRSGTFSPGNGDMTMDASSTILIDDDAVVIWESGGVDGDPDCNFTIGEDASITFATGNTGSVMNGCAILSTGDGSTVTYEGNFSSHVILAGNYYNLTLSDDGATGYSYAGDIEVRNNFTYNIASDMITTNTGSLTFTGGGTTTFNCPSYTGAGVIPDIIIDDGTTLNFGTLNGNTLSHNQPFTNNGIVNITGGQTIAVASQTITNGATGVLNIATGGTLNGTGTSALLNSGTINYTGDASTTLTSGNLTNSGTITQLGNGAITLTSGDLINSGTIDGQADGDLTITAGTVTNDGTFNIGSEGFVTVTAGALDNDGTINIADDGSLVQGTGSTLTGTGSVSITRATDNDAANLYNLWSAPIADATMGDFTGISAHYEINPPGNTTADWSSVADGTSLISGKGYAVRGVSSQTFTGTANNGDIDIVIGYSDDGSGTNAAVVGNPYPSSINAEEFLTTNSTVLDGFIRFFNYNSSTTYDVANQLITVANLGSTTADDETIEDLSISGVEIGSCQGFYVCVPETPGGGTVSFSNSMRNGGANNVFKDNTDKIKAKFHLQLIDQNSRYNTLFGIVEGTTLKYDRGWDAQKESGRGFYINSKTIEDQMLSIQSIPEVTKTTSIPLALGVGHSGYFNIHLRPSQYMEFGNFTPYILDAETGVLTDILEEDFEFYAEEAGNFSDRFYLVFARQQTTTDILNQLIASESTINIFVKNEAIHAQFSNPNAISELQLMNVSGKIISETKNVQKENSLAGNIRLSAGVYLANVIFKNGKRETKKISF